MGTGNDADVSAGLQAAPDVALLTRSLPAGASLPMGCFRASGKARDLVDGRLCRHELNEHEVQEARALAARRWHSAAGGRDYPGGHAAVLRRIPDGVVHELALTVTRLSLLSCTSTPT